MKKNFWFGVSCFCGWHHKFFCGWYHKWGRFFRLPGPGPNH